MLVEIKNEQPPVLIKIIFFLSLVVWQLILFYLTYYLYHQFNYTEYITLESWIDHVTPYISWSWIIYYFGFFYIAIWGMIGIWKMNYRQLKTTILAYAAVITTGAVIRLIFPSDAPWIVTADLHQVQVGFKTMFSIEPLGGFPSMHAGISTLTAFIGWFTFRSYLNKFISSFLALLVCLSIITAKEHWAIDVPAGIIVGLVVGFAWLYKFNNRRSYIRV